MSKENEEFLSLYRTYEGQLRMRDTDYRSVEDEQAKLGNTRMTIMRQMRNYLAHSEDPGFITISPMCVKVLDKMVKEERMRGDIVKNHLVTPAKGSVKEGTQLSAVILKMIKMKKTEIPVYDNEKQLRGLLVLEDAAYVLDKQGNIPLTENTCGPYKNIQVVVRPDTPTGMKTDAEYVCCTKDGTLKTAYMGYLDK